MELQKPETRSVCTEPMPCEPSAHFPDAPGIHTWCWTGRDACCRVAAASWGKHRRRRAARAAHTASACSTSSSQGIAMQRAKCHNITKLLLIS